MSSLGGVGPWSSGLGRHVNGLVGRGFVGHGWVGGAQPFEVRRLLLGESFSSRRIEPTEDWEQLELFVALAEGLRAYPPTTPLWHVRGQEIPPDRSFGEQVPPRHHRLQELRDE